MALLAPLGPRFPLLWTDARVPDPPLLDPVDPPEVLDRSRRSEMTEKGSLQILPSSSRKAKWDGPTSIWATGCPMDPKTPPPAKPAAEFGTGMNTNALSLSRNNLGFAWIQVSDLKFGNVRD